MMDPLTGATNDGGKSKSKKKQQQKSPCSKGPASVRKRFQLFDPTLKDELNGLCEGGLITLKIENEKSAEDENDNSVSLEFDGDSDVDEFEDIPKDVLSPINLPGQNGQVLEIKLLSDCLSCNVSFNDVAEQRLHYTLDWHRYNVKRKVNGQESVTETKFNEIIDDLSSIDGSDDEEEDRLMDRLNASDTFRHNEQPPQPVLRLTSSQKLEKSPKIFFINKKAQIISCHKCILKSKDTKQENVNSPHVPDGGVMAATDFQKLAKKPLKITIILLSGGHAAAGTFVGNACTNHKTFHSYTVRAKQGGGQSNRDNKCATSHAKSAGASLRRYNEQSFTQHVQDLFESWKTDISQSDLIFYRAVSSNSHILFGGKTPPLSKENENLRTIPFPTKRPTFSEVKRVHSLLTTIHIYDSLDSFYDAHSHLIKDVKSNSSSSPGKAKSKNKKAAINRAKSRSPKRKDDIELDIRGNGEESSSDEDIGPLELTEQEVDFSTLKEFDDSLTPEQRNFGKGKKKSKKKPEPFKLEGAFKELVDSLTENKLDHLLSLLEKLKESNESNIDLNQAADINATTLLHMAARSNHVDVVWSLMESGCDPAIKDKSGKYAYNYAESRECRDMFRKFMGQYPDKYDYKKAHIPPPLSEEMEKERAERKKLLNKLKKEKEKQKKAERKEKEKETEEQRRFLNLSDREKRALAAEQRILATCKRNAEKAPVLVRCFECATDITGKVPFEYNQNVFCTPKCLASHRKKFPCPLSV